MLSKFLENSIQDLCISGFMIPIYKYLKYVGIYKYLNTRFGQNLKFKRKIILKLYLLEFSNNVIRRNMKLFALTYVVYYI